MRSPFRDSVQENCAGRVCKITSYTKLRDDSAMAAKCCRGSLRELFGPTTTTRPISGTHSRTLNLSRGAMVRGGKGATVVEHLRATAANYTDGAVNSPGNLSHAVSDCVLPFGGAQ